MKIYPAKIAFLCLGMVLGTTLFFPSKAISASNKGIKINQRLQKKTAAVPLLSLSEPKFAFSGVIEGTEIRHTFVVKNKGTAVLEIQKVRTG